MSADDNANPFYIVFSFGVVVFDRSGNRLVECPTEDEAVEWIDKHINNSRFDCE